MSAVDLRWGDGSYHFELKGRQIEELQRACGVGSPVGIGEIAGRVFAGRFFLSDIVETIRLGLIGGGVAPVRAKELIEAYVDGQPLADPDDPSGPLNTAKAILQAAFLGIDKVELPKKEEGNEPEGEASAAKPKKA